MPARCVLTSVLASMAWAARRRRRKRRRNRRKAVCSCRKQDLPLPHWSYFLQLQRSRKHRPSLAGTFRAASGVQEGSGHLGHGSSRGRAEALGHARVLCDRGTHPPSPVPRCHRAAPLPLAAPRRCRGTGAMPSRCQRCAPQCHGPECGAGLGHGGAGESCGHTAPCEGPAPLPDPCSAPSPAPRLLPCSQLPVHFPAP